MAQEQHLPPSRRACAPISERLFHLACRTCTRAITNELIRAPKQHARACAQANWHVRWLPGLTQGSSAQLVARRSVAGRRPQLNVESSSARLAGLASLCQKRARLFPRPNGPPPCEGLARKALSGRRGAQEFAYLAMAQSWPRLINRVAISAISMSREGTQPAPAASATLS